MAICVDNLHFGHRCLDPSILFLSTVLACIALRCSASCFLCCRGLSALKVGCTTAAFSPTADSPGYVPVSDPEEDLEEDDDEDPEEDPADYPADRGDDGDDENESSDDDKDDDVDIEEDEEEEEHLAPAELLLYQLISIRDEPPISFWSDIEVAILIAIPTLPQSPLSPWSSPLPQIPSPPLPLILSPLPVSPPVAAMIRLRAKAPSTSHLPPPHIIISHTRSDTPPPIRDRRAHARTTLLMEREARMSREAWGRSMDASDLARSEAMIDQGVTAALAARDANRSTNGDDSHVSGTSVRRMERVARESRSKTVAGARETVGSPVVQQNGIQCFNCKGFGHYARECRKPKRVKDYAYHKEKMMMCKQAEQGVPLQAEQADWLEDTDEEIDEQELEAHYSYMAKIQEVSPAESSSTDTPLEQVQNHDENDVFANVRRHSEQPESINDTYVLEKDDSNVIPDSSNICTNDNQVDQNAAECVDERAALANLIANLTLDTEENKTILKQLKKANASLTQELKECKTNLDESSRALGEATSSRNSSLIALQTKQTELEKYTALNDLTSEYNILQTKLNDTLGLLAIKDIDIQKGLKTKTYEISVVNQKHDELVKKSMLTRSQFEGQLKEKSKVISDLKVKEGKDIDTMIEMKKKCMDKGSKERIPPHNLRQKSGQYICCQNHKLIADIENL
ncbi:integrase, catalytic region, zinc finger, CCHC-type containing protein [Tanacetum coccineum]